MCQMASPAAHQPRSLIGNLDPHSTLHVFSYLGMQDLCSAAMVCRDWSLAASDDSLWRALLGANPHPMMCPTPLPRHSPSGLHTRFAQDASDCHLATARQAYLASESWRKGRAVPARLRAPGSDQAPAIRISPCGKYLVQASGGIGACRVFDLETGKQCRAMALPQIQGSSVGPPACHLDGLYSCAAISSDCSQGGFGGHDGTVLLYDVTDGAPRALLGGPQHHASVQALALSRAGSVVAAGLSDGRIGLARLPPPSYPQEDCQLAEAGDSHEATAGQSRLEAEGRHASALGSDGCVEGLSAYGRKVARREWTVLRQIGDRVGVTCLEMCPSGEAWAAASSGGPTRASGCSRGTPPQPKPGFVGPSGSELGALELVAGTSGGHVMLLDGETGAQRVSLVGSCSCPVGCLCIHGGGAASAHAAGGLIYGSFHHGIIGHGHHNSVYVWDVASASRIALLYPGGKTLRYSGGGGRAVAGLGGAYVNLPVKSVYADGYKVALTAGRTVTVFERRTWEVLYEFSLTHHPQVSETGFEGRGLSRVQRPAEQVAESGARAPGVGGGTRGRAGGEGSEVIHGVTAGLSESFQGPVEPEPVRLDPGSHVAGENHSASDSAGIALLSCGTNSADPSAGNSSSNGGVPDSSSGSRGSVTTSRGVSRAVLEMSADQGEGADQPPATILSKQSQSPFPLIPPREAPDEPAHLGIHFVGEKLAVAVKGGAVGVVTFGDRGLAVGLAKIHVTRPSGKIEKKPLRSP